MAQRLLTTDWSIKICMLGSTGRDRNKIVWKKIIQKFIDVHWKS